jgi:hypothetical protein
MSQKFLLWLLSIKEFTFVDLSGYMFDHMIEISETIEILIFAHGILPMLFQVIVRAGQVLYQLLMLTMVLTDLRIYRHRSKLEVIFVRIWSCEIQSPVHF